MCQHLVEERQRNLQVLQYQRSERITGNASSVKLVHSLREQQVQEQKKEQQRQHLRARSPSFGFAAQQLHQGGGGALAALRASSTGAAFGVAGTVLRSGETVVAEAAALSAVVLPVRLSLASLRLSSALVVAVPSASRRRHVEFTTAERNK